MILTCKVMMTRLLLNLSIKKSYNKMSQKPLLLQSPYKKIQKIMSLRDQSKEKMVIMKPTLKRITHQLPKRKRERERRRKRRSKLKQNKGLQHKFSPLSLPNRRTVTLKSPLMMI